VAPDAVNTVAVVVAVDVAVVGGGLQGLVLLRELVSAGYGCVLITNADLGAGQTLHSHGLLNSGTGLVAGALQEELYRFTLPYLRAIGVPVYGEDRSFLLAPDALVDQLTPVWEANHYRPERADPASLPLGFEPVAPVYRVQGFNVEKRRLVAALSAGLEPLVLGGEVVEAGDAIRVGAKGSGETLSFEPRAVVVAAGCGTKRLLRRAFGVNDVVLDRITYRQTHMICVRGPAGVLPEVGAVVATEVMIVGHLSPDGLVTWYVTPAIASPEHDGEAPDDGAAEVDVHVVKQGIDALLRLVPSLSHADERIQATVFAGYKQDFDGQPTRRACEVVDEDRNVVMALPSVLTNAVPNARDALTLIGDRLGAGTTKLELRREAAVAVGQVNEDTGRAAWRTWRDFAGVYDVAVG
jgi:glycine/D-amino acid oxidase-like deaminating enzyme